MKYFNSDKYKKETLNFDMALEHQHSTSNLFAEGKVITLKGDAGTSKFYFG